MTVQQARRSVADAAHLDVPRAPVRVGSRAYSESVPAGRVVAQTPAPGDRVERNDLGVVLRVSLGTAYATGPGGGRSGEGRRSGGTTPGRLHGSSPHGGVVGGARGARDLERPARGRGRTASRASRPRRLERPAEGGRAGRSRDRGRRRGRAARRELRRGHRREGLDARSSREPCCGSRPAPDRVPSWARP